MGAKRPLPVVQNALIRVKQGPVGALMFFRVLGQTSLLALSRLLFTRLRAKALCRHTEEVLQFRA